MAKYHKKYTFRVEIDGIEKAAFRTVGGPLQVSVEVVEENEGGSLSPSKEMGRVTYENVTLTGGVTDNIELWEWMKAAIDGDDAAAEKDLSIVQTDRAGEEIRRWDCFSCKPVRFVAGDWDATASENVVEEFEVSIESFDLA